MIIAVPSLQSVLKYNDRKTVNLMEQCDQYFSVDLTKEEFGELIKELTLIYDSMVSGAK